MIDFIPGIATTTSALNVERIRMDIISQNIANANTTQGPNGEVYQRQQVVFETALNQQPGPNPFAAQPQGVQISRVEKDHRAPQMIYNPGQVYERELRSGRGMVAMPNVSIQEEMADMISSSRSFEANLAVLKNARMLALQTLAIGKRV